MSEEKRTIEAVLQDTENVLVYVLDALQDVLAEALDSPARDLQWVEQLVEVIGITVDVLYKLNAGGGRWIRPR